jgi:ferredoxin
VKVSVVAGGVTHAAEVPDGANLVVLTGVRKFPHPHLKFKCGMGKCGTCASRVLEGGEHLPAPSAKEAERLGPRIAEGWRLMCQLWPQHDITISQE